MSRSPIRIATRRSPLALWQAEHVAARLRSLGPGRPVELLPMVTQGDQLLDAPLARVGGKGLFVKELETAILAGEADLAVHSVKDIPVAFPPGLHLAALLEREDPRDALVSAHFQSLDGLPVGARVGTSSLRRRCQLLHLRPDLRIEVLRGNLGTRLDKLEHEGLDAIVLAVAGLRRLGLAERIAAVLTPEQSLPAVGQGAIGIECRAGDEELNHLLARLHHPETGACVGAERAMNTRLNGGCQAPIAGYAAIDNGLLRLRGLVAMPDGSDLIRGELYGPVEQAQALGTALGESLLSRGADRILAAVYAGDWQPG